MLPLFFSILLLITAVLLIPRSVAFAQSSGSTACGLDEIQTDFGCWPNDPILFVQKFYVYGVGLIGGIALLMLIYGGYNILTSRGEPNKVNIGKSCIIYSIVGLLLAIFGYVFIQFIAVDILHIPGFGK